MLTPQVIEIFHEIGWGWGGLVDRVDHGPHAFLHHRPAPDFVAFLDAQA
jgi:hypothetical protein